MALIKFKALNDGTKGFRFRVLNTRGIVRIRKFKNRPFEFEQKETFTAIHFKKFTFHMESNRPRKLGNSF